MVQSVPRVTPSSAHRRQSIVREGVISLILKSGRLWWGQTRQRRSHRLLCVCNSPSMDEALIFERERSVPKRFSVLMLFSVVRVPEHDGRGRDQSWCD